MLCKFGDASGSGFGSLLTIKGNIYYCHGQWSEEHGQESSNYRELVNLVYVVEDAHTKGFFCKTELFIFTDNATAESSFFKGTSKHKKLFELIL